MRKTPTDRAVKMLFAASGGVCAFTGSDTPIIRRESGALLGEMCHIRAASLARPRYDPDQSDDQRTETHNLIILRPTHHSLIDQDPQKYSAAALQRMKAQHETRVATILGAMRSGIGGSCTPCFQEFKGFRRQSLLPHLSERHEVVDRKHSDFIVAGTRRYWSA